MISLSIPPGIMKDDRERDDFKIAPFNRLDALGSIEDSLRMSKAIAKRMRKTRLFFKQGFGFCPGSYDNLIKIIFFHGVFSFQKPIF